MTTPVSRNPKRQRQKEGGQRRRQAELEALQRQRRNRLIVRFALVGGLILAVGLVLSLVGDDGDDTDVASTTTTTALDEGTTTSVPEETIDIPNLTCTTPAEPQTDLSTKPTITPPAEPAGDLTCLDHVVGDGEEVKDGDTVQVHYVGVLRADGTEFDASYGGEPATFGLDGVISGWTQGIPGMKVGGRRELIIPSVMAYGADGRPGIPPDADLVFIIDLLAVNPT
jgi:peptidylprolyl isomerase